MGLVLLWVHDNSDGAATTRRIVRRTAPLVVRALSLVRLPVMRGMIEDIAALMDELKLAYAG
jgi:hypothetical protein